MKERPSVVNAEIDRIYVESLRKIEEVVLEKRPMTDLVKLWGQMIKDRLKAEAAQNHRVSLELQQMKIEAKKK